MTRTLIAKISLLEQYNPSEQSVLWEDSKESRWKTVYELLQLNDSAVFFAKDRLLIGVVTSINPGQNILCSNIQEVPCKLDQLLQLHETYPELIPRARGHFQPFIHPKELDITQLINDISTKQFVSFYIISSKAYEEIQPELSLKTNDRVVLINDDNQLQNVKLYTTNGLIDFPGDSPANISVEGLTLEEILNVNKNIKRKSSKSNNVKRIEDMQKAINQKGFYKFTSFIGYHDGLFNKLVYDKLDSANTRIKKIQLINETIYKVSMGTEDVNEELFSYCNENNLIIVHQNTKAMATSKQSQAAIFSKQMKVGDYFYMCRGNKNLEIIGRVSSDAEEFELESADAKGWLQRSYDLIAEAQKDTPYVGLKKWWTPNNNSTCVQIPAYEIQDANSKLFNSFFNVEFQNENTNSPMVIQEKLEIKPILNQILYGPPGTGKTYNTINKALEILGESTLEKTREQVKELFDSYIKEGRIVFTTFHQNMSYEDFIEGIKPIAPKVDGHPVIYQVQDGIFKKLCSSTPPFRANDEIGGYKVVSYSSELLIIRKPNGNYVPFSLSMLDKLLDFLEEKGIDVNEFKGTINSEEVDKAKYPELEPYLINGYENLIPNILRKLKTHRDNERTYKNTDQNKVLIIDEINRGNVSQIFGELIALIEEDKRLGNVEALQATLPYSKDTFGVPSNLYIIGTMNTADRSVEALDAALRRRFSFVEMPSNPALIATEGNLKETDGVLGSINLPDVLSIINKRIEKLIDRDHHIGHSYFMSVSNIDELKTTFRNKIIPLLQEYFFGDYGKIGLVLGHGFVEEPDTADENLFASFGDYDASDFAEKPIYKLKEISNMTDEEFNTAINLLLKK